MVWIGKGRPRKFCSKCYQVERHNDVLEHEEEYAVNLEQEDLSFIYL